MFFASARHTTQADIQPTVLFGNIPGVAGKTILEKPEVTVAILPVIFDFMLQSGGLQLIRTRVELLEERPVYRTAGATGADQIPAAQSIVDEVIAAIAADLAHLV